MDEEEKQKKKYVYGRLYRIYKTACEMMLDRGYLSAGESLTEDKIRWLEEEGPEGFLTDFQNRFPDLTMMEDNLHKEIFANEDGDMILFIFRRKALTLEDLQKAFKTLIDHTQGNNKVILSMPGDIDKTNSKLLEGKDSKELRNKIDTLKRQNLLEIFDESTIVYNITRHNLVPKHIPLSDLEKSELLAKYKITPNQLPKILMSDPVTKYFGMKRGDVFKIIRTSETAGKYVTYRICV